MQNTLQALYVLIHTWKESCEGGPFIRLQTAESFTVDV